MKKESVWIKRSLDEGKKGELLRVGAVKGVSSMAQSRKLRPLKHGGMLRKIERNLELGHP